MTKKEDDDSNALIAAACKGHEACVRMLIAARANLDYSRKSGETALIYAAFLGNAAMCRVLVDEGASLSAVCNDQTPLELAKATRNTECVAILEAAAAAAVGGAL